MPAQCAWSGTASEALHFEGNNYCPMCLQPLEAGVEARPVHLFLQRPDSSLPRCSFVDASGHQCECIASRETWRCPMHRYAIV
jgi:hypothetical protein